MVCDLSKNNLRENLEKYVNGLIAANAKAGFNPQVIADIIYKDVEKETNDPAMALGMAYHVPSLVASLIDQNPKFGTMKFIELGYDPKALRAQILMLEKADNKLDAIAGYLGVKVKSLDQIEEDINNQPTPLSDVVTTGVTGTETVNNVADKMLAAATIKKTTIEVAAEDGKVKKVNERKPGHVFYQDILQKILNIAGNNVLNFRNVKYGTHTGFRLKAMLERDLLKEVGVDKLIPGRADVMFNDKPILEQRVVIMVLTDNYGDIIYFKPDGTIGDKATGKPWYNMLPTKKARQEGPVEAFKAEIKNKYKREATPEEIANFRKALSTEDLDYVQGIEDRVKNNNEQPLVEITGGSQGSYRNLDTFSTAEQAAIGKPLSEFSLSETEQKDGIQFAEQNLKGDVVTMAHMKFDNFAEPISLKNSSPIGDQDTDLLDNIVEVLTSDVIVGGEPLTAEQKLIYVGQFIPVSVEPRAADPEKGIKEKKAYTIGLTADTKKKVFINIEGSNVTDKQAIKDFLAKNAYIHVSKRGATQKDYVYYKLTETPTGYTAAGSRHSYFEFLKDKMIPRIPMDITTKRPMILNGYFSFGEVNETYEIREEVAKTTEKVKEQNIPTNNEEQDTFFDNLKSSKLIADKATPEQDTKAKAWWEGSALKGATDAAGKPLFTLNLLRNVVNSDAFATFANATITLYEGGDYTHVYDEAWHAFSQVYMTKPERTVLYNALSKLPGTFQVVRKAVGPDGSVSYNTENVAFSEASRRELEEFTANEFRTFAMNGGKFKVKNEKTSALSRIFNRIWKALKALVGGSDAANVYSNPGSSGVLSEMFDALYTAKKPEDLLPYQPNLANAEFGVLNAGVVPKDEAKSLSLSESLLLSRTIDGIFSDIATKAVERGSYSMVSLMFSKPEYRKELYDRALKQLNAKRESFMAERAKLDPESIEAKILDNKITILTKATDREVYGSIINTAEGYATDSTLIGFHTNNSTFKDMFGKIKISKEEAAELDEVELADRIENMGKEGYNVGSNEVESEKLASDVVLYVVKSLTKMKKDGTPELNELGFAEPIDFKPFWRLLMDKASGETSILGLYNKLREAELKGFPLFGQLIKKIYSPKRIVDDEGNVRELSPEETLAGILNEGTAIGDLWMKMVQSLNLHRIDLTSSVITTNQAGEIEIKVGKTTADYQRIVKEWGNKFQQQPTGLFVGKDKNQVNFLKVEQVADTYLEGTDKFYVSRENYIPFLNSIGIYVSDNSDIRDILTADDINYIADAIGQVAKNNREAENSFEKVKPITNIMEFLNKDHTLANGVKIPNNATALKELAQIEASFSEEYASSMRFTPDGNLKSVHALNSTDTQRMKALNKAKRRSDLYSDHPEFMHMNYLDPINNPTVKGSVLLNSLFSRAESGEKTSGNEINMFDMAGTSFINEIPGREGSKGVVYSRMNASDKLLSDFISSLAGGLMQGVTPGDKSSYFAVKVDRIVTYEEKRNGQLYIDIEAFLQDHNGNALLGYNPLKKLMQIMYPKLEGEIRRIAMIKADPEYYSKISGFERGTEFDIFDDILESEGNYTKNQTLKEYLKSDEFLAKLEEAGSLENLFNTEPALKKAIDEETRQYFTNLKREYDKTLFNPVFGTGTNFGPNEEFNLALEKIATKHLKGDELGNVSYGTIRPAMEWAFMLNNFIHKTETTLLLQGDGFQFEHAKDDSTKRTPGSQSSGRIFPTDTLTQLFINNRVGRKLEEKMLKDKTLMRKEGLPEAVRSYTGLFNSAIIKESEVASAYFEMYRDLFKNDLEKRLKGDALKAALYGVHSDGTIATGKKNADGTYDTADGGKMHPYAAIKDGDGQGWITFDSYRILKKLEGMWSDKQEDAYNKIVNGDVLSADQLTELFPVYKLQYNGSLATERGRYPVQAFHKFSLFPLIPSVIKGKPAEKMHHAMMSQNIDYTLFKSGSKRSFIKSDAKSKGDAIYEGDTSNIKDDMTFTPNPIYVAYLKNQTDVNSFFKDESTFSTQLRKLITAGLYQYGVPVDYGKKFKTPEAAIEAWDKLSPAQKRANSKFHTLSENLKESIADYVAHEKKVLLEQVGWEESDLKKPSSQISKEKLLKMFQFLDKELKKQDFSDHERSILNVSSNLDKVDLSSSPLASRFERVIMSIVNKRLVRLKLKGEPFVEVSSAFMQDMTRPQFEKPTAEQKALYDDFGTNGISSYIVDPKGKKDTIGFRFKRALTEMDQRLFNTDYYALNDKGEYAKVPIKNRKGEVVGYEKIGVYKGWGREKKLDFEASFNRLNEMVKLDKWLEDDNNKKKIRLTGVRIPVQGDNSMEFGQVYEFLRPDAGPVIIIPAEIVAKSGTDFDVDKMTTYLPYITRTGKLLEHNQTEEELESKIEDLKKKLDVFKKNKEIIKEFSDKSSANWLDIDIKLSEFRHRIKRTAAGKEVDDAVLKQLMNHKNKELLMYIESNEDYLKRHFSKAHAFYIKNIKGVTLNNIEEVDQVLEMAKSENKELSDAYSELSDAKDHFNNFSSAIQNKMLDDMVNILQLPEKAFSLLSPNDTNIAKPLAEEMKGAIAKADDESNYNTYVKTGKQIKVNGKTAKGISPTSLYREDYNNKKQQENIAGKGSLGITAIDNYMNNMLNMAGGVMNKKMSVPILEEAPSGRVQKSNKIMDITLKLPHNLIDGKLSMSHLMDAAGEHSIAEVISQLMNGFVDVGKDAWVAYLQGNMEVIPKILFMIEVGVPLKDIAYFVSNPITREYVKEKGRKTSVLSNLMYDTTYDSVSEAVKYTKMDILRSIDFSKGKTINMDALGYNTEIGLTMDGMPKNGNLYGYQLGLDAFATDKSFERDTLKKIAESKMNLKDPDQVAGFMQYLYIEKLIEDYDALKKAMNPDTKTTPDLYMAEAKIEEVKSVMDTPSLDPKIAKTLVNDSLIAPFFIQQWARDLFGRFFALRDNPTVNKFLLNALSTFGRANAKKATGYDIETYITKFKNFLGQYIFTDSLRQYDPKKKVYKGTPVSDQTLKQLNEEYDHLVEATEALNKGMKEKDAEKKKAFLEKGKIDVKKYPGLDGVNMAAFQEASREQFIEFALERKYLQRNTKLENVKNTKEFELRKRRLTNMSSIKYAQLPNEPDGVYQDRLDNLVYADYLTNKALTNTYNIWQLFRSGDNTIARELMDIIENYPELSKLSEFAILQQFIPTGIAGNDYKYKKVLNFQLRNWNNLDKGLIDEYNKQWKMLANSGDPTKAQALKDPVANAYISDFFTKLPFVAFMQSGMDSSQFSLASVMPYEGYREIFEKASQSFQERLKKPDADKVLDGMRMLFENQNAIKNKIFRNRGLNYKKPISTLAKTSLYEQPFLTPLAQPGTFLMDDTYVLNGETKRVTPEMMNALRKDNKDTTFILTAADVVSYLGKLKPEQLEEAKKNVDTLVEHILNTGNNLVVWEAGLRGAKLTPSTKESFKGKMTFEYGTNKRESVEATNTFDAILNGERTATTRYASQGTLDYWKKAKVGDTITWQAEDGRTVDVIVTKPLHALKGSGKTAEQWSKLEGWSVDYFNKNVKGKLAEAWQIEFKLPTEQKDSLDPEVLVYLSRQLSNKLNVKIGPQVPNMLKLLSTRAVVTQEQIDNKKLEC